MGAKLDVSLKPNVDSTSSNNDFPVLSFAVSFGGKIMQVNHFKVLHLIIPNDHYRGLTNGIWMKSSKI